MVEGTRPVQHLAQHAVLRPGAARRPPPCWPSPRFWMTHARALKFAGTGLGEHRSLRAHLDARRCCCSRYLIAASSIDTWTVVRFAGSRGLPAAATAWHDAVFQQPLSFYLFDLPFYLLLRSYVLALVIFCILLYWVAARGWQLRYRLPDLREPRELDPGFFRLEGGLESRFLRGAGVVLLLALAVRFLPRPLRDGLQRARLLPGGHRLCGPEHRPAAAVAADLRLPRGGGVRLDAAAGCSRRPDGAGAGDLLRRCRAPCRRCTCARTRSRCSGLTSRRTSTPRAAPSGWSSTSRRSSSRRSPTRRSTSTQHKAAARQRAALGLAARSTTPSRRCQALRTYYVFHDSDVDRYTIDGQYRQVLLSPRELDISQLPDARAQLDQSGVHLHARLRPGAGRSQQDDAGRPARAD